MQGRRYAIPFAWEVSADEPLAQVRLYAASSLTDNQGYTKSHPESFFEGLANAEKPRATVVTCSDSRVQTTAWDATPEGDAFVIRNIGNQLGVAEGSVEYGVRHLKTPLLLILGHTGCGAVKAALEDSSSEPAAVRRELEMLRVRGPLQPSVPGRLTPPYASSKTPIDGVPSDPGEPGEKNQATAAAWLKTTGRPQDRAWALGVITNVNHQVSESTRLFADELASGQLTVIGAIYDLRNDFDRGYGRLLITNVNGNTDVKRVAAFTQAVSGPLEANSRDPNTKATIDKIAAALSTFEKIPPQDTGDQPHQPIQPAAKAEPDGVAPNPSTELRD